MGRPGLTFVCDLLLAPSPVPSPYSGWLHGLRDLRGPPSSHTGTSSPVGEEEGADARVAFLGGGFSGLCSGREAGVDEETTAVGLGGPAAHTRLRPSVPPLGSALEPGVPGGDGQPCRKEWWLTRD